MFYYKDTENFVTNPAIFKVSVFKKKNLGL
ncbi:hypothetical protein SA3096_07155 [Aggregatibacter actinomycetemcomitans serotype e str. SA3096]|nr:hypothetical protein SA3096_07155 [Aggregatibacter actinomycetemcomitans serotype e str. SA3096]